MGPAASNLAQASPSFPAAHLNLLPNPRPNEPTSLSSRSPLPSRRRRDPQPDPHLPRACSSSRSLAAATPPSIPLLLSLVFCRRHTLSLAPDPPRQPRPAPALPPSDARSLVRRPTLSPSPSSILSPEPGASTSPLLPHASPPRAPVAPTSGAPSPPPPLFAPRSNEVTAGPNSGAPSPLVLTSTAGAAWSLPCFCVVCQVPQEAAQARVDHVGVGPFRLQPPPWNRA